MSDADSTMAGIEPGRSSRLATWASRAFTAALLVVCVGGVLGLLGGRTATAVDSKNGYHLTLSYPATIRPGLDALWKLTVVHDGGFHGPVTVAVSSAYFDLFETQGFYPTPSATTTDDTFVYMTFTPPHHGKTLTIRYDAYLQPYIPPSSLFANDATVAVVAHGKRLAAISYTVWVLP